MSYDLQKLRDLPIEGVAERLGLEVSRHKALCPFHPDKHPSLTFNNRRNTYRCWSCGAHGDVIDLVMKLLPNGGRSGGGSFAEACRWLNGSPIEVEGQRSKDNRLKSKVRGERKVTNEAGNNSSLLIPNSSFDENRYQRFFDHPFLSREACHFLFDERKLDPRVVRWCRLNSYTDKAGIHWLQIPYYDQQGRLIGIQSRNLTSSQPRFLFWSGSRVGIYNLPVLNRLRPGDDLYIAEGCSDCWAHLSAGHKCIAIPSATLLKPEDLEKAILPLREGWGGSLGLRFHMYPDQDAPGEALYQQLQELASRIGFTLVRGNLPPGCKDYSDFYCKQKQ